MLQTISAENKIVEDTLLEGESPMFGAPSMQVTQSKACVPQHFLIFNHTLRSVEEIVTHITFDEHYLIFVDEDASGVFLQIGIIGQDNYRINTDKKIVYGRKWRVEASLPSSEIIQTVFLALKSAREHEIRELFQVQTQSGVATPFNNHHDIPMMANNADNFLIADQVSHNHAKSCAISDVLESISYDKAKFKLLELQQRANGTYLLDIQVLSFFNGRLHELVNKTLTLLIDTLCSNTLLHELMTQLVLLSNRYVEENFKFKGLQRFSRNIDLKALADTSINMRSGAEKTASCVFKEVFKQNNYQTDSSRVPRLHNSQLGYTLKAKLEAFAPLNGILPSELT